MSQSIISTEITNPDFHDNFLKDMDDFFKSTTRGNTEIKYFNITKKELLLQYPDLFERRNRKIMPKEDDMNEIINIMKTHYIPYLMTIKDKNGLNKYKAYTVSKKYTTKDGTVKVYQNARLVPKKIKKFELLENNDYIKEVLNNLSSGKIYKVDAIDIIWDYVNSNSMKMPDGNNYEYKQILNWIYRK